MANHSSTLAWKIPWMAEPGRLQSMGSRRVGHDWATLLLLFTFMHWRTNGNRLQCSCLENPRDGGAWWAGIYGVAQSQTWLKRLSSSSCNSDIGQCGTKPSCAVLKVYIKGTQFSSLPLLKRRRAIFSRHQGLCLYYKSIFEESRDLFQEGM